jgi:hypothetical protein
VPDFGQNAFLLLTTEIRMLVDDVVAVGLFAGKRTRTQLAVELELLFFV